MGEKPMTKINDEILKDEILKRIDEILEYDDELLDSDYEPTDYEMITNNSVGICYHDGCM